MPTRSDANLAGRAQGRLARRLAPLLTLGLALAVAPAAPAAATTIGFEAPRYTVGSPPPSPPWYGNLGDAQVVDTVFHSGTQSLAVGDGITGLEVALYFAEAPRGAASLFVRPSTDIAGANFLQVANIDLGRMGSLAARVSFQLNDNNFTFGNPGADAWQLLWSAGGNGGVVPFQPGGWLQVDFSWDVASSPVGQVSLHVVGAGVDVAGSGNFNFGGSPPMELRLGGGGVSTGHAYYDDLTLAVPEPGSLALSALPLLLSILRRRRA